MARKNQRLINYHTGNKTAMPSGSEVHYGEIVVRHNAEAPELLIKVGDDSFGVFQASGAVQSAITSAVSAAKSDIDSSISTLEQSLSGHVANFEAFQKDVETTYATKTELSTAESNITTAYTKMVDDAKVEIYNSATSFASKEVQDAKGELNASIESVSNDLDALSGVVKNITTNINDNYVTTGSLNTKLEEVASNIAAAKKEATDASSAYTDTKFEAAKKYTDDQIDLSEAATNGLITALESTVNSFKTEVANTYVTKNSFDTKVSELEGKISDAQTAATNDSKTYTDNQIALAKDYSDGKLSAATETLKQSIKGVEDSVTTLSGNVHTTINDVKSALTQTINEKVAVAYRYAGSCTYAELPSSGNVIGEVWNVTDANGNFPAGTNYAWTGSEWDALGGSIDLSPYAKTEDVDKKIATINQTNATLKSDIDNLSAATESFSAATISTFATKTELSNAQTAITTAYTKAVSDAKAEAIGTASGYTDAQVLAAKNALNQAIETVDGRVTDLSGVTKTVKATADKAVQTGTTNNGSGVVVTKNGTSLDFDFLGLIIDCGDF